jgi:predicted nuclease of predicted toxin-antitoxin system
LKPSASNKDSRPNQPTLFIDRSAWSNALHAALEAAGISHEAHRWHFAKQDEQAEEDDSEWLRAVADRGWVVVTRDKNIRYRVNELAAMRAAKLHVFVFTQGALTARETGRLLVDCYPAIVQAVQQTRPPAFFSIARSGQVRPLKLAD